MAICTFERTVSLAFIEKMLAALTVKPMTRPEMESALFASKTKVLNYLRLLHGEDGSEKRIYVMGFDTLISGGRVPRYAAGNRRDAKPPGKRTSAERHAMRKADPEKHRRHLAKLRASAAAKRSRKNPVTWFAALPGASLAMKEAA